MACAAGGANDVVISTGDTGIDTSVSVDATDAGPSCKPSEKICSDKCVDITTDKANCGVCGTACRTGQLCCAGACTSPP